MKEIVLAKGRGVTLVDDGDYEELAKYSWYMTGPKNHLIAARNGRLSDGLGPAHRTVYMHRAILNPPADMVVDHINGNSLDNRRENLRICDRLRNQWNRRMQYNKKCGVRGVHWHGHSGLWHPTIKYYGKCISLGYYKTIEEAAVVRREAELKYFGEFACHQPVSGSVLITAPSNPPPRT